MAITVFDAVGKFFADTSNLDEFITKLERGLPTASDKAAVSTQLLKAAQLEFRDAIKAVSAEGGNTAENMDRLAAAEKDLALASAAAKEEHAALRAELIDTKEATGIAAQATEELTGKLTSMFGILALAEGFKSLIEGAQKSTLQLQLLSEKTGIAIDTLAGIEHVTAAAHVSFEQVSTALTRLSRAQELAIEGGKQQVTAFERIGISAKELKNLSPEQLFYRVAEAMSSSSSHAAETASAFVLLGRGGAELIPILQQNTEALRAQIEEAAKSSNVTKEAGQAAKELEAEEARASEQLRAGLIPTMQLAVPVLKGLETAATSVTMVIRDLGAAIGGWYLALFNGFTGLGSLITDTIHGDWDKLVIDAKATAGQIKDDFGGIQTQFKDNFAQTAKTIKEIWEKTDPLNDKKDTHGGDGKAAAAAKIAEARLAAQKAAGDAEIELAKSQEIQRLDIIEGGYSLENAKTKEAFAQQLDLITNIELQKRAVETKAAEDKYQNDLNADKKALSELEKQGNATLSQQIQLKAKIEALEKGHQQKIIDVSNKAIETLRKTMSQPIPLINTVPPGMDVITNAVTKAFDQARDAAHALGITLKSDLDSSLSAAYENYDKLDQLFKQGIVTQKDLDAGYAKLIQAQLKYAIETGQSSEAVKKLENQLKVLLQTELAHLKAIGATPQAIEKVAKAIKDLEAGQDGTNRKIKEGGPILQAYIDKLNETGSVGQGVAASLGSAITLTTAAFASGSETMVKAIASIAQAEVAGIAAIADKKGAEQLARAFGAYPNFAEMASHFESASLWFALGGAVAALGGPLAGVGNSSSTSGSSSSGTAGPSASSPNVNAGSGPSQVVNTTHFALGALVSQPMLAMVGDSENGGSAEEAIIPLHNNTAIEKIAKAILAPMQHLARMSPNLSVPASLLYPETASTRSGSGSSASGFTSKEDIHELAKAIRANPGQDINIHLHGSFAALAQEMAKELNHGTKTGRIRLHSTSTDKTIKKA